MSLEGSHVDPDGVQDRFAIAEALREMALLLGLKGENRFKVRAYERGAEALEQLGEDLDAVIAEDRLTEVEGIGSALASVIAELYRTGTAKQLVRLREEVPRGLIELSRIDGLTEKRIAALGQAGIDSVETLRAALDQGKVKTLKGFGPKTEEKIRAGLERHDRGEDRTILIDALDLGARLLRHVRADQAVPAAELGGELRRWHEEIGTIAVIAASTDFEASLERFCRYAEIVRVESRADRQAVARLASGARVQLELVPPERFGLGLLVHTGAEAHVSALELFARSRGTSLTAVDAASEEGLYAALGLPFIPPEQREGRGEIEAAAAGNLDGLLEVEHIRGMVHAHTTFSDGKNTVAEMAEAADALGIEYLTITDHSPSAFYARGVEIDRLKQQWDEIAAVQERVKVKLLRGTESDINADGSLDYPDEILEQLDVVIASIHSRHQMDEAAMTERIVKAMKHPAFKIWGHALGRLVLRRDPIRVRIEKILDVIAASNAAIEVNGDPYRLDLPPDLIPLARERGIKFVISVDAHSTGALRYLPFGVHMARRGGLLRSEVLNTLPAPEFASKVKPFPGAVTKPRRSA